MLLINEQNRQRLGKGWRVTLVFFPVRHFRTERCLAGYHQAFMCPAELAAGMGILHHCKPKLLLLAWDEGEGGLRSGPGSALLPGGSPTCRDEAARTWSHSSGGRRCLENHPYTMHAMVSPQLHSVCDPLDHYFLQKTRPAQQKHHQCLHWLMSQTLDGAGVLLGWGEALSTYCPTLYMARWEEY